jgi:micrococcal nuclease
VLRVIDGDTVEVAYKGRTESVRVIGIDTPETVDPSGPVECWGPRASAEAERFLAGERVQLRFDKSQGRRDTYDRLLAHVVVPGGGDFGQWMISRGHAAEYTYDTAYNRQGRYTAAEAEARAAARGLRAACGGVDSALVQPSVAPPSSPRPFVDGSRCPPGYGPCVPPYPPDVDCADVDGPITVTGDDPHGLDGDYDGIACDT